MEVCQSRQPGPGRDYYVKKTAEGKTPREARRALKRRLSNVLDAYPPRSPARPKTATRHTEALSGHARSGGSACCMPGRGTNKSTQKTPAGGLLGHLSPVHLGQVHRDLAMGQALGREREDEVIHPGQPPLPLG